MIEKIRNFSTSWVARGFFLFLAVSFGIMWGGGDLARRIGIGDHTLATIGKLKITGHEFEEALARQVQQLQIRYNESIDREKAKALGLQKLVLENLVNDKLIQQEAERLNLSVTDDYIRRIIKQDPNFKNKDGSFNRQRFDFILSKLGYTEQAYIKLLRNEILKEQIFRAFTETLNAPLFLSYPLYAWQSEKRRVSSFTIESSQLKISETPSEQDLLTFYDKNEKLFHAPEYRDITVLVIDASVLKKSLDISEKELKEAFEAQAEEFKGKTFAQVKASLKENLQHQKLSDALYTLSNQIEDEIAEGKTFEEVAQKHHLGRLTFQAVDKRGRVDEFSSSASEKETRERDAFEQRIIEEAFRQDQGTPGSVIEAGEGKYFLARVDQIKAPHKRPFNQVKEKVKAYWIQQKQVEKAAQLAEQLAKEINEGGYIEAVANRHKFPISTLQLNRQGPVAPSAVPLPDKFVTHLFTLPVGKAAFALVEGKNNHLNFQVAVVKGINLENPKDHPKEVEKFRTHLGNLMKEDIIVQYLYTLRKRFPVEVNKKFFSQL